MSGDTFDIEMFYDGACPLCMRETRLLQRRDVHGRIRFTDIAAADFSPDAYGRSERDFMDRIQGRLPNGQWLEGVEVFRRLYEVVGFRRLVWVSRLPVISQLLGVAYDLFAKNRLRLTGRCVPAASGACDVLAK